jgi:hypothetical protein
VTILTAFCASRLNSSFTFVRYFLTEGSRSESVLAAGSSSSILEGIYLSEGAGFSRNLTIAAYVTDAYGAQAKATTQVSVRPYAASVAQLQANVSNLLTSALTNFDSDSALQVGTSDPQPDGVEVTKESTDVLLGGARGRSLRRRGAPSTRRRGVAASAPSCGTSCCPSSRRPWGCKTPPRTWWTSNPRS